MENNSSNAREFIEIYAPISLGELIDKISILQIKADHLDGDSLVNVRNELKALQDTLDDINIHINPCFLRRLKEVNQGLWKTEDDIRDHELQKKFDNEFIALARSVYKQNDKRAAIKKEINKVYGSFLTEEKSYSEY